MRATQHRHEPEARQAERRTQRRLGRLEPAGQGPPQAVTPISALAATLGPTLAPARARAVAQVLALEQRLALAQRLALEQQQASPLAQLELLASERPRLP